MQTNSGPNNIEINVLGIVSRRDNKFVPDLSQPDSEVWFLVLVQSLRFSPTTYIYRERICHTCYGAMDMFHGKLPVITPASLTRPNLIVNLYGEEILDMIDKKCREFLEDQGMI